LANQLTGKTPAPVQAVESWDKVCPKCAKKLVENTAKGGSQAGNRFWVCPDYPQCKTAFPLEES
jgi:ssDNA-binding Zn-finger/Zn-ribbon topoisomerase 1